MNNLIELRNILFSHEESVQFTVYSNNDALDQAAMLVIKSLQHNENNGYLIRIMKEQRRIHHLIKSLITVGSQLVTISEYRDLFEDILTKVNNFIISLLKIINN